VETDGLGNKKLLPLLGCCKTPLYSVQYERITRVNPKDKSLLVYAEETLGWRHHSGNTQRRTTALLLEDKRKRRSFLCGPR